MAHLNLPLKILPLAPHTSELALNSIVPAENPPCLVAFLFPRGALGLAPRGSGNSFDHCWHLARCLAPMRAKRPGLLLSLGVQR